MATLNEIWANKTELRYVAFRSGTLRYVALGHKTVEKAIEGSLELIDGDTLANDWIIGEIVPNSDGKTESITIRGS